MAEEAAAVTVCLIDQLISGPLFAAPLRRASCWSNVRSAYVFWNLTPDSSDRLRTAAGSLNTAADTSSGLLLLFGRVLH